MKTCKTIKTGDKVRLVSVTKSMNPWLQKQFGCVGEACSPSNPFRGSKVLVSFDGCIPLWVLVSRLEVVE